MIPPPLPPLDGAPPPLPLPAVLVLDNKRTLGFPEEKGSGRSAPTVDYRPLGVALAAAYGTDAHFAAYASELPHRLRVSLFDRRPDGDLIAALALRGIGETRSPKCSRC